MLFCDLILNDFLSLQTDVNVPVPTESNKQNKIRIFFSFFGILEETDERAGSEVGSVDQVYGSKYPHPYQNVTDPEHCMKCLFSAPIPPHFKVTCTL